MRHLILVFVGLITTVYTQSDLQSCFNAFAPVMSGCCEIDTNDAKKAVLRECHEKFPDNNKCDFEICYAEKKGFLLSNGTVDKGVLEHLLESDLAKYSNILSIFKQKCLNVDNLNDYGQAEMCYLKKLGNCMRFFLLANCPKWSNEQRCHEAKSASQECAKMLT